MERITNLLGPRIDLGARAAAGTPRSVHVDQRWSLARELGNGTTGWIETGTGTRRREPTANKLAAAGVESQRKQTHLGLLRRDSSRAWLRPGIDHALGCPRAPSPASYGFPDPRRSPSAAAPGGRQDRGDAAWHHQIRPPASEKRGSPLAGPPRRSKSKPPREAGRFSGPGGTRTSDLTLIRGAL